QFDQDKIMTQVLASQSSFALDRGNKYYFVGGGNAGGYGVSLPPSSKISLEYLLALLNSSLLDWKLRKKSSRFHGGFYSYAKRFIEELPIQIPDKKQESTAKNIEDLVKEIISNRSLSYKFLNIWIHWISQMRDAERTFADILRMEEDNIKDGDLVNTWFDKISFLPSKKNPAMIEKYDYFKIRSDYEKSQIEIFGVNENGEKSIFELVLKNNVLVDHFHLSLLTTAESRARIETLEDLFEKTKISVLQPNPSQKTPNIMLKVIEEFSKEGHKDYTFVKMENKIEESEAKIDALVFKLYGLIESEIDSILNSLSLPMSYQFKVKKYFLEN
ncbi:MAG: hypothetical protein KGL95_00515, partial [Patescibacteria group bacterium]|nr:hypothetical protein [Patescibacteria group bacterium]